MLYRVDRTYLTDAEGRSHRQYDMTPYFLSADDAADAVSRFINADDALLFGTVSRLAGDKATGSATNGRRFFVVFAQRGAESIQADLPSAHRDRPPKE